MSRGKQITEKDFNKIKRLKDDFNMSDEQIIGVTGRSKTTILKVFRSDTYEEYKEATKVKEKVTEVAEKPIEEAEDRIVKLLRKQNKILKAILSSLK